MGLASILLGVVAIVAMVAAVFLMPVPNAGAAFACGALLFSLLGIVMGGVGISRSGSDGSTSATAVIGLVLSILAFLMSVLVAMTCGACNTLCSSALLDAPPSPFDDGGMRAPHDPTSHGPDAGSALRDPNQPDPNAPDPNAPERPPEAPPPAFPPPAFPPPAFPPPDFPPERDPAPTEPGGA
jgi:hypothetical protein